MRVDILTTAQSKIPAEARVFALRGFAAGASTAQRRLLHVILAKAGIQGASRRAHNPWIAAFAAMTGDAI